MSDIEEARALLEMAAKDWRALSGMSDSQVFAEEVFGFHAQQAVEKALKAWLAALGQEYPLTHNLAILLSRLQSAGADVAAFWDLVDYNPFGVQFRYEAADEGDEPLDRGEVVKAVRALLDHVAALADAPED